MSRLEQLVQWKTGPEGECMHIPTWLCDQIEGVSIFDGYVCFEIMANAITEAGEGCLD